MVRAPYEGHKAMSHVFSYQGMPFKSYHDILDLTGENGTALFNGPFHKGPVRDVQTWGWDGWLPNDSARGKPPPPRMEGLIGEDNSNSASGRVFGRGMIPHWGLDERGLISDVIKPMQVRAMELKYRPDELERHKQPHDPTTQTPLKAVEEKKRERSHLV